MTKTLKLAAAVLMITTAPAMAEWEVSLYTGTQSANDSSVSGTTPDGTSFDQNIDWSGDSFESPFYFGGRVMWWNEQNLGFGIEGTHTKATASDATRGATFSRLEFTDGHNIITANVMKRWPGAFKLARVTPYLGAGVGLAIPNVDIQATGTINRTREYEVTGPAVRGIAGVKYDLTDHWALFTEYQFTYSDNDATIEGDAGQPDGDIDFELLTHALNVGFSYSF